MNLVQIVLFLFLSTQGPVTYRSKANVPSGNSTSLPTILAGELVGNITLTPSQGPFVIEKDLFIPEGSRLILQPGVQFLFRPETGIQINGTLVAEGSPENKISFSSLPHPNARLNASFYYANGVRLVDGNNYNEGRLEIKVGNRWGVICADHWIKENTEVACRHLGFLGAKRYYRPLVTYMPYVVDYFKCNGDESSLWSCKYSTYVYCPYTYPIGIECMGLERFLKEKVNWQGMSFMTQPQGPLSTLKHVTIEDAVFALKASYRATKMSSVTVRNSFHGIQINHMINQSELEFTDILVYGNMLTGMKIMNSKSNMRIYNSSFAATTLGDGLSFEDETAPIEFCSWSQNSTLVFPLMLSASSDGNDGYCTKEIQLNGNSSLSLHYRSIKGSSFTFEVSERDAQGNWTVISTANENDDGKLHIPSKATRGNGLKIEFRSKRGTNKVEFVIIDEKAARSLFLSNCTFLHNGKHGVNINNFAGHLRMTSGRLYQNGLDGAYINGLAGKMEMIGLEVSNNNQVGVAMERNSGTIALEKFNIRYNNQDGIKAFQETGVLIMKNGVVKGNRGRGIYVGSLTDLQLNLVSLEISVNNERGLYFEKISKGSVNITNVTTTLNSKHGAHFTQCSTPVVFQKSYADMNGGHGFYFQAQGGFVAFLESSVSRNQESGLRVDDGVSRLFLENSILKENKKHGFYSNNHGKEILMVNVSITNNSEIAINVYENSRGNRITLLSLTDCYISGNKVGMNLMLSCAFRYHSVRFVNLQLRRNTFANNSLETFGFYHEHTCYHTSTPRQVFLNVINNTFIQNKKSVINIRCPGIYALQGSLSSNVFLENLGKVVTIKEGTNCGNRHKYGIRVDVTSNRFENNTGQYMVNIDLQPWYTIRSAVLQHNSFVMNKQTKLLSRFYSRMTEDAVVVLKEGTFQILQNSFENPNFTYQVAAALFASGRVINATHNWWGTKEECKIKDMIFDKEDRLDLVKAEYYPFLLSNHSSDVISPNITRPLCFLRESYLGGTLDRHLVLSNKSIPYRVMNDLVVLPKGSLVIESNVTLIFPPRSAFVVQGSMNVYGEEGATVSFSLDKVLDSRIRLKNGWYGNVEIKYNNVWMTLCVERYFYLKPYMMCNHFDMEYESYSLYTTNGDEAGFINNFKCDYSLALDMSYCNYKSLSYTPRCSYYVLYLRCKRPYWSGVHLAMTRSKSTLSYLEIHEGGYNYRSTDLKITSAALRVDFDNHVMRNIKVKNSASVGVHVLYSNPFKNVPTLSHSLVDGSESNGLQISFSSTTLDSVDILNTKERGIYTKSLWNDVNIDAQRMSDPEFVQRISNCKARSIFIKEGHTRYFIFSPIEGVVSATCDQELHTTNSSTIGVQMVYKNLRRNYWQFNEIQVYSGEKQWGISKLLWQDRPVLYANRSSIRLRFIKYYSYSYILVHLLVFTLNGTNTKVSQYGKLSITNSTIKKTSESAVVIDGNQLESINLLNSTVQDSVKDGLGVTLFRMNLLIQSSVIERHSQCIYLFYPNFGIHGNALISNNKISGCTKNGIYIWSYGEKNITIRDSLLISNIGVGVHLDGSGSATSLYIKGCRFSWNRQHCISVYSQENSGSSTEFHVLRSSFSNNAGRVINIHRATSLTKWLIEGNIFYNNYEPSVFSIGVDFSSASYTVRNNSFISNRCTKDGVIDLGYNARFVDISKNTFVRNIGPSVTVNTAVISLPLTIVGNTFEQNVCPGCPILRFLRTGKETIMMENNTMVNNTGLSMILIQAVHVINSRTTTQTLALVNNTITHNHPSSSPFSQGKTCIVEANGILVYKRFQWQRNKISNSQYDYEFCLHTFASTQVPFLIANETWWGVNTENDISRRVFSFDINYEYGIVEYGNFLALENKVLKTKEYDAESAFDELFGMSMLKGRIHKSITLERHKSPFKVLEDVTVLSDTVLTIEPGVTVQLAPYTSILVLGTLIAKGNQENHITFKHMENTLPADIRLMDGKFPWHGRFEVYDDSSWKPVCTEKWTRQNSLVACRQLGYDGPNDSDMRPIRFVDAENNLTYPFELQCSGDESGIAECSKNSTGENNSCQSSVVELRCRGKEWGSIRFSRPSIEKNNTSNISSVLEYVDIMYAGKRRSSHTSAIEMIRRVPIIRHLKVLNCSYGGINIVLPDKNLNIESGQLINTGGTGITVKENTKSIVIKDSALSNNDNGIVFTRWNDDFVGSFPNQDGVFLCDNKIQAIDVRKNEFLYFATTPVKGFTNNYPTVSCQKRLRTEKGMGIALRVLSVKGSQTLRVHIGNTDVINTAASFWKSFNLYIDFDDVQVNWQGAFSSRVILLARAIPLKDMPCTFIRNHMCGWQSVLNKRVLGKTSTSVFKKFYFSDVGHQVGIRSWRNEYVNLVSPLMTPNANVCRLHFEYDFQDGPFQYLWLAVVLEEYVNGIQIHTKLWSSDEEEMLKGVYMRTSIKIPLRNKPYRVVISGHKYSWGYRIIYLRNLKFESCFAETVDVNGNVFTENQKHSIMMTSDFEVQRFHIKIHRNKITDAVDDVSNGAIRIDTYDNPFYISNNFLSGNNNGGVYATVGNNHGNSFIRSTIERNNFQGNKKQTIYIDTGYSGKAFTIDIFGNTLNGNNGAGKVLHSTIKLSQVVCILQENFVYDNHGKYILEILLSKRIMANRLIVVHNNTFYHNHGLIKDYGSTMYCNGPVNVYKNVIKNPSNLYELVTDRASISRTMNAIDNWWGFGSSKVVGTRIVDVTDDYRLPKVNYHPYIRLRPPTAVPLSCPAAGWVSFEESCFLYLGGPLRYYEADNYCLKYGSHLLDSSNEPDMSFIKSIFHRYKNQTFGIALRVWIDGSEEVSGSCSVYGQDGNFSVTPCESLQPFVCSKTPLIRCPNNCFHNGKCIGTTCFCNKGWTGLDCSKFHCNNLRNCSGHGTCVGPNVCRCLPGISGRACTYSYCTQFENCRSCISSKNCGWCDSLGQCLPGHGGGSYFGVCQDWFFYNCYTMGRTSFCSRREIMLLDCNRQLCNFKNWRASKEACQRCKDQEKCFQAKDAGSCRTWNETRCRNGQVKIDYSDATRVHNTQMNVNTRIISPEKAMMYRCESNEPDGSVTTIFVFNSANLTLKPANVISSNQAGGVFHKVLNIKTFEPYTFVTTDPASLGDFIRYADFQIDATLESLNDEVTEEAEPNMDVVNNLLQGNASLNETFHVIPEDTFVYKCVGHMYEKADATKAASYYLVLDASKTPFKIETGDVIVSTQSHGYLSTITNINKTSDFIFVETLLLRCSNTTDMNFKFPSRRLSDKDISCPGGDNNPNLLIKETNNETFNWSVNDVIADRPSQPFVAKVKSFHYSQGYLVVEVLQVTSIVNETAVTDIEIGEPLRHVRRKGAVYNHRFGTKGTWGYGYPEHGQRVFNTYTSFGASFSLTLQLEVSSTSTNKLQLPKVRMNIYMYAEASAGISVYFKLHGKDGGSVSSSKSLVKGLALKRFSLCFYVLCIPAGIFFDLDASGSVNAESMVLQAMATYTIGISKEVGNGECSTTGRCQSSLSQPSISKRGYFDAITDGKLSFSFKFTPRLRLQIPAMPRLPRRIKWLSKLLKMSKKVKKIIISSVTINVNLEIPLIAQGKLEQCSGKCRPRSGLKVKIGATKVSLGISIGQKNLFSISSGCIALVTIEHCYGLPDKDCEPSKKPEPRDFGCGNDEKPKNGTGKCGDPPVCLTGWSGEGCSKPDPPSGCVNGQAFGSENCTVTCKCDPGWIGNACDVRAPSVTTGDPHLTTFDGVNYDYFGIGELWGCQSIENDFGLQFRFFAYERSSLTGGIALKAGNNTITIMTVRTPNSTDLPILRLNGQQLDVVSLLGEEVKLDNGTVLMSLHRKTKEQENASAVLLMSVEYKSGAAVSFDVRHSKVMGRQYINIGLTPTIQFKQKTSGLYGYMDGDPSNDFQGPDGKIYSDPIQFANSWKITTSSSHSSTGWSWKNSNFHPEDVMDHSYIDPNFVPMYNLEGISQQAKEKAVSVCSSMGLSGDLLKSCVYDIAITNDTSLSEQETLQQGCENVCSGRGRCINSTCECIEGWSGKTCEIGQCSNCSVLHGKCVSGFCHCNTGWEGEHCDQEATCFNRNNCTSPLHGKCKTTDVCLCNDGFTGKNCSIIPTCHEVANCSSHGVCVDFDVCKCHNDWTGKNCSDPSCHDLSFCSGHGRCIGLYECNCDRGWRGVSCGVPDCPDVNQCSQNGDCILSNKCKCKPGFQGEDCSSPTDCSFLSNCTNHGICENTDGKNSTCRCFSGFSGPTCNETSCEEISNCTNHGECIDANLCNCSIGYTGYDCSNFSCEILNFCSGRGECVDYDVCKCSSLWHGIACTIPKCTAFKDCSQKGDCIAPNTCECYRGYDGNYCDQLAPPNLHHPVFNASEYNFTLNENSPAGTPIGMVVANDSDTGRNGKISYSLVSNPHSRLFLLNGFSGAVSSGIVIDYETIQDSTFKLEVIASDDGFPQKFTKTSVFITIRDVNDNCPVFDGYPPSIDKTILYINASNFELFAVVATDADSGENGYVTYGITPPTIQRYFAIDPYNGTITVVEVPQPDVYNFDVVGTDYGDPPCESKKAVKLTVHSIEDKTPSTEKPTTEKPSTTLTSTKLTTTKITTQETEKPKTTDKETPSTAAFPSFPTTTATTTSQAQATKKPQFSDMVKIVGFSILGVVILAVVFA